MRELEASLQQFGEFILTARLVKEKAAPVLCPLGPPIPDTSGFCRWADWQIRQRPQAAGERAVNSSYCFMGALSEPRRCQPRTIRGPFRGRAREGQSAETERHRSQGGDPPSASQAAARVETSGRDHAEQVQRVKKHLATRKPKTVNNVLTVLNTLLKKAVEWGVIDRMPCTIRLLRVAKPSARFHDFADYERLVTASRDLGELSEVIVLLGGEAGLRCGEIAALE